MPMGKNTLEALAGNVEKADLKNTGKFQSSELSSGKRIAGRD